MFGFAGAARTGKTTVATAVAQKLGIHYHNASISAIARELGVNAVDALPMMERVKVQEHILDRYVQLLEEAPRPAITDRTPLDMIAYMLGEVTMHNTDPELGDRIQSYVDRCLVEAARHFDTIIFCRPLDNYVVDPKSPPPNRAYQWQTQLLMEGAAEQIANIVEIAKLKTSDAEGRVEGSSGLIVDRLNDLATEAQAAVLS